jgi:hypothetical protein
LNPRRRSASGLVSVAKDAEPSLGIRLLGDLRTVFDGEAMASKVLLRALIDLEESPWGDLRGRALDERGLARRLRQYGVRSKTFRPGQRSWLSAGTTLIRPIFCRSSHGHLKGRSMKRREFITFLAGAAASWPHAVRAQQTAKVYSIGYLGVTSRRGYARDIEFLLTGLHQLGYE